MAGPLDPVLARSEWLETDGLGGFASGTVGGIRTRRYHALLLAALNPPADRMVLVNGLDAELETATDRLALSTQRYTPGVESPDGSAQLESFRTNPWPTWTFAFEGGNVICELVVPHEKAAMALRWKWEGDRAEVLRLRVRLFLSGRDFHGTHHENSAFRFDPEPLTYGQRWKMYPGVPAVRALANGTYHHEPCWYRNFQYDEEKARGLDFTEDLGAPGIFEFNLAAGPAVLILCAENLGSPLPSAEPGALWEQLAKTEANRRGAFISPRHFAADAYLVQRGAGRTIIAGYPWFGDWGRDTFISMRGLCLATGRLEEARNILVEWAATVSQGMLPNRFPDRSGDPEYNSVDASLWYIVVVHEFLQATAGDEELLSDRDVLFATVDAILTGYRDGTRFGIRADEDGMLACGVPGVQLTWMDAKVGDWVVTPRIGKPVEVQALWLNALELAGRHSAQWQELFERGHASFLARFWNEARGCLYDVVDVDHQRGTVDDRLRPNQIFAVGGLPVTLLDGDRAERVVEVCVDQLWTPLGPRSLAPGEKDYAPHYEGTPRQRDGAYHQGTVWPWLAGPFIEAWLNVRGTTVANKAAARALFLEPGLENPYLQGIGHVPEIADAEDPHTARGCPFQAWSLGELLRIERLLA